MLPLPLLLLEPLRLGDVSSLLLPLCFATALLYLGHKWVWQPETQFPGAIPAFCNSRGSASARTHVAAAASENCIIIYSLLFPESPLTLFSIPYKIVDIPLLFFVDVFSSTVIQLVSLFQISRGLTIFSFFLMSAFNSLSPGAGEGD